jgi:membrane fusion protein (multidrug efflux system)
MFARVNAVFSERENALIIPEEAIIPQGGRSFVVRVVAGANKDELMSERVAVKIGIRQPGKVEILEGLSVGDSVVVAGHQRLQKDGTVVRVVDMSKGQGAAPNAAAGAPGAPAVAVAVAGAPNAPNVKPADKAVDMRKAIVSKAAVTGENPCLRGLNATR